MPSIHSPRHLRAIPLLILLLAGVIRLLYFSANDRLQGDVNLFALSAREFVRTGQLYYPMKYDYSSRVEWSALRSPASQHPPLFSWLGGVVAKLAGTMETFAVLKWLCFAAGIGIVALVLYVPGLDPPARLMAGLLAALTPMLADFSANGSVMMSAALCFMLLVHLVSRVPKEQIMAAAPTVGILCGLAWMLHGAFLLLGAGVAVCWTMRRRRVPLLPLAVAAVFGVAALLPWFTWNHSHLGHAFHSWAPQVFWRQLGLADFAVRDGAIVVERTAPATAQTLFVYAGLVVNSLWMFLLRLTWFAGPGVLTLAALGAATTRRKDARAHEWMRCWVILSVPYLAVVLGWAMFKERFLVPILPGLCVLAGIGFGEAWRRAGSWRAAAVLLLLVNAAFWSHAITTRGPTTYYFRPQAHRIVYTDMREVAMRLEAHHPHGIVLGYSNHLDGGLEAIYWHGFPFIHARGFDGGMLEALMKDFPIVYIWADADTAEVLHGIAPSTQLIEHGSFFRVYRLPPRD